jgi:hypothetical protein
MLNAIKEQQKEIEMQRKEIEQLKGQFQQLPQTGSRRHKH